MNNINLTYKLIGGFGIVMLLFICAIGTYQYANSFAAKNFNALIHIQYATAHHAMQTKALMLKCRQAEKNFLLERNKAFGDQFLVHLKALKTQASRIGELARKTDDKEMIQLVNKIEAGATLYRDNFSQLVNAFEQRGLDHDSGLQGTFSKIARKLGKSVKSTYNKEAQILLLDLRRVEKNYLLFKKKEHANDAFMNLAMMSDYPEVPTDDINSYRNAFKALIAKDSEIEQANAKMNAATHQMETLVDKIQQDALQDAEQRMSTNEIKIRSYAITALGTGLFAAVLGVFLSVFVTLSITRPVKKTVTFADHMAQGDLTQCLRINQKDEIGMLVISLNHMTESLRKTFGNIAADVDSLTTASTELSGISRQLSANADQSSKNANDVAAAAEEMNTNMSSVAAALDQTSTNVKMVASATEEMSSTINEIAQDSEQARSVTEQAVSQTQSASRKIESLGTAAKEINKVTEVITEISEQTNLLALNATIEAARAGSAGRGFTVVATEIKKLAHQTAGATQEIKTQINGIQNSTTETIHEIHQITNIIESVSTTVNLIASAVEEQAATTQEISNNIAQAAEGIEEVNRNITQSSTVSTGIAHDILDVNQAAGEMAAGSHQVNTNSEKLLNLSEQLKQMIGTVKI